jgi:hypothetical protein
MIPRNVRGLHQLSHPAMLDLMNPREKSHHRSARLPTKRPCPKSEKYALSNRILTMKFSYSSGDQKEICLCHN